MSGVVLMLVLTPIWAVTIYFLVRAGQYNESARLYHQARHEYLRGRPGVGDAFMHQADALRNDGRLWKRQP